MSPPVILKFGSSVLRGADDYARAVHEIHRFVRRGHPVVAVVSAVGGTTDQLLRASRRPAPDPAPGAVAADLLDLWRRHARRPRRRGLEVA